MLKPHYAARFETGIGETRIAELTPVARAFDELLNRSPNKQAPYVGKSLRHQGRHPRLGHHEGAETYEHVRPETVGNRRHLLVSGQAGKSNLLAE